MARADRKSTRLNSSHTVIYTLSLHDALPISRGWSGMGCRQIELTLAVIQGRIAALTGCAGHDGARRSEEHTSELQSHRDLHSFPTRRSSDLSRVVWDGLPPN